MKTLRLLSLATVLAFVFAGCSGPTGPQGPAGANGANGANGNANVVSYLYNVSTGAWTYDNVALNWYVHLTPVAALTSGFINAGGVVSVFFSANSGTSWNALPYTEVVGASITASWSINMTTDLVQVNYAYSDQAMHNDPCTEYGASPLQFSVTCIAAGIVKKHPSTNWSNYYEVQKVVNEENGMKVINQ